MRLPENSQHYEWLCSYLAYQITSGDYYGWDGEKLVIDVPEEISVCRDENEIYAFCRQIIATNQKLVDVWTKKGKSDPLVGAVVKTCYSRIDPQTAKRVIEVLLANPDAQPEPGWEQRNKEQIEKWGQELREEQIAREHFNRGALFAYQQVANIMEADKDARTSHNWPMGEMYQTLWNNVMKHVHSALKAHKK
jgi:hypothetical protein